MLSVLPADGIRQTGGMIEAEPLDVLRTRTSVKWRMFPPEVLPLWVAEMDYPLAPEVAGAMIERIAANDTGYAYSPLALGEAFASFASDTWGWMPDPTSVRMTTDVSVAIAETLRQVLQPGDGVVVTPPVYPPFFDLVPEAGGRVVEVPLLDDGATWSLDLDGLEAAFAAGARAFLLCNPHNPLGLVHSRESLAAVAELADRFGVIVVSDEIHGPLVHPGVDFTPYLSVSDAASDHGIIVTSASKAFNLAGTKCAFMVSGSARTLALLDAMPDEVTYRTSLLGLHASIAAFLHGRPWLDGVLSSLVASSARLTDLLAAELPGVVFRAPQASYLAWLDLRALGWGDDPAVEALARGVALNAGPTFGQEGRGFARLNFACGSELLDEAIARLAR